MCINFHPLLKGVSLMLLQIRCFKDKVGRGGGAGRGGGGGGGMPRYYYWRYGDSR